MCIQYDKRTRRRNHGLPFKALDARRTIENNSLIIQPTDRISQFHRIQCLNTVADQLRSSSEDIQASPHRRWRDRIPQQKMGGARGFRIGAERKCRIGLRIQVDEGRRQSAAGEQVGNARCRRRFPNASFSGGNSDTDVRWFHDAAFDLVRGMT